ncbi:MAG: hypothetical protein WCJ51_01620 [Candidatus Moraniibacteriota bacterium]
MNSSFKQFFAFLLLPVAVLLFSGCGSDQTVSVKDSAPVSPSPAKPVAPTPAPKVADLPELPADNKQAIDKEIQDLDQTLKETDATLSADATDGELGL